MELKVNNEVKQQRIEDEFKNALEKIQDNANNGIAKTELLFPNDIFIKCRTMLNEYMKENHIKYGWMDMGGYMSVNHGTHRMMKFSLKQ